MKASPIYVADTSSMQYRPGPVARTWARQLRRAFRSFAPPAGPFWLRQLHLWIATPAGLFGNFALGFVGTAYYGPRFFMIWLMAGLFAPAALMYHRLEQADKDRS